ncbi:MAG TPA: VOC family protein [Candidatus Thermoplasmatota archaeon]|nr:VOC family protein [Candidatus Thermoplasmatota archaeon]
MAPPLGRLEYLYVGSADVGADLAFYRDVLGARVAWDFAEFGTRVAAVEVGARPPLYVLAGHRPPRSVLPIFVVDDLDAMERALRSRGWTEEGPRVEVPDGPVRVLRDASGNEVGLLESVRPRALER